MMRIPTDVKAVLNRALETWGLHEQGRATNEDWIDEIADAFVMLYQLALIHGEEEVCQRFFDKIQRLHLILEGQGQHSHLPQEARQTADCAICHDTGGH